MSSWNKGESRGRMLKFSVLCLECTAVNYLTFISLETFISKKHWTFFHLRTWKGACRSACWAVLALGCSSEGPHVRACLSPDKVPRASVTSFVKWAVIQDASEMPIITKKWSLCQIPRDRPCRRFKRYYKITKFRDICGPYYEAEQSLLLPPPSPPKRITTKEELRRENTKTKNERK